jgi:organic radical activating enzyme
MSYSPKRTSKTLQGEGAQIGCPDVLCRFVGSNAIDHYILQPSGSTTAAANFEAMVAYRIDNPCWRLVLQLHKLTGVR